MTQENHSLPLIIPTEDIYPSQWTREGSKSMGTIWRKIWTKALSEYKENLAEHQVLKSDLAPSYTLASSALAYLYSRTGYDAGRVMSGFHKARTSWGTYQDQMCRKEHDEWHCNAHSNNLVIIPEGSFAEGNPGFESFLSYLDLDMAFSESAFVNVEKGEIGIDCKEFDCLLWKEHVNLMETLSGGDSSSGVPAIGLRDIEAQSSLIRGVKTALSDTLILGYLRGYTGDVKYPVMAYDRTLHKAAHNVIRMAIIIMADYIA